MLRVALTTLLLVRTHSEPHGARVSPIAIPLLYLSGHVPDWQRQRHYFATLFGLQYYSVAQIKFGRQ